MAAGATIDRNDPLKKALTHGLAFWAILPLLGVLVGATLQGALAFDFHHAFLPAARAVLHGASPYSSTGSRALAEGEAFLYPPLSAFLFVPFVLLPVPFAEIVAVALVAAMVPATLLVLDVRDWRCHLIAFLWLPTIVGIQTANLTLPLVLGLALLWRCRDRQWVAPVLAGLVVALKLFFWPVLIWLVATRRYGSAALAAVVSALLVLVPWAGIGFAGLRDYPHLLASVSRREGPGSYSVAALLHGVVPNWGAATVAETLVGVVLVVLVFAAGRGSRDREAFALSVVAVLVFTPLLEMHYLAALLVVVALYRRTFSLAWAAPLLMWGAPVEVGVASTVQVAHVLVTAAATVALTLSDWRPRALLRAQFTS